jgi:hypothetical protein
LEEDEPAIIGFMVEYFYKGDVSVDATVGTSQNPIDLGSTPRNSSPAPSAQDLQQHSDLGRISYPDNPLVNSAWLSRANAAQNPVQNSTPSFPFGYTNSNQGVQHSSSSVSVTSYLPARRPVSGLFNYQNDHTDLMERRIFAGPSSSPIAPAVNAQNLVTLASIYVVAEKYDVQPLKLLTQTKYEAIVSKAWNTEHFVRSLEVIYDGTQEMSEPDSLRDLAIKTAAMHAKELMIREDFMNLCKDRGDFATDVLQASLVQTQAAATAASRPGGSGVPRCSRNSSHPVYIHTPRTYGPPMALRYKCAVCNNFID